MHNFFARDTIALPGFAKYFDDASTGAPAVLLAGPAVSAPSAYALAPSVRGLTGCAAQLVSLA